MIYYTRIGMDGIVSLLLFGTVGFQTDDILSKLQFYKPKYLDG